MDCIACGSAKTKVVIDLGLHPPADSFIRSEHVHKATKLYPLQCEICEDCGHLQNRYVVPPNERYVDTDYSYTASNSKISCEHWNSYALEVVAKLKLKPTDVVFEFGSNDGYLLHQFKKMGLAPVGIDPSPYLARLATDRGVETVSGYLGADTIAQAVARKGKAKLICGNNVFNHIGDLSASLAPAVRALSDDGYFVFESPYSMDVIHSYYFDTIYHEHVSYFSVRSTDELFRRHGLFVVDVERNLYHGGCIRVYASKRKSEYNRAIVEKFITEEQYSKLFDPKTYDKFMIKILQDRFVCMEKIYSLKSKGKKIVAIGAAARANTLLNFYRLDSFLIDCVTDSSPHKIGKYTPGSLIPIKDDSALAAPDVDMAMILSWNIGKFLVDKIRSINAKIEFIIPGNKELL